MENKSDYENQKHQEDIQKQKKTPFVVHIPSYEEVVGGSQSKPQSLFDNSNSFSQAFNFVKKSEFYTSPPPAPLPQPSKGSPSTSHGTHPRKFVQPEASSTSVSSAGSNRNAILVSNRQKGNPLLKHIRNVRWVFADVVSDFLVGQNACVLYLSLRYHLLHPDYLYFRIRELQKNFKLRVVLCHVDVEDVIKPLLEVTKTALLHDCTLLCAWSLEECGRYLETIKVYENKSADLIQGQMDMDYMSRLNNALTSVRHVNKADVVTLGSTFGSLSNIMDASMEDLARCPGIGEKKVKRLYDTFHEPFNRFVPNHAPADTANVGQSERKDDSEEIQDDARKRQKSKKAEELSVKSALKAAFAKYSEKLGKNGKNVVQDEIEEKSAQVNSDDDFAT